MTHIGITVALSLVGIIILLLGLGGGKMWGEGKVDGKIKEVVRKFKDDCDGYRLPCQQERIDVEKKLATSLEALATAIKDFQQETQQMLLVGTFTMDLFAKYLKIPDAEMERIKINVKNGTYENI